MKSNLILGYLLLHQSTLYALRLTYNTAKGIRQIKIWRILNIEGRSKPFHFEDANEDRPAFLNRYGQCETTLIYTLTSYT